jgi:hypothetical protein
MDENQYENSYGLGNTTFKAFSTMHAWENITEVKKR